LDFADDAFDLNSFRAVGTPTDGKFSSSLLSLFCYRNSFNQSNPPVVNCCEHVDQGFLSIEPCTQVDGLEVFLFGKKEWVRIDKFMNKDDLILFCSETMERITQSHFRGVLHRVGPSNAQRLSMVYKMRHKDITPQDIKLHFGSSERYAFYQYDENGNLVEIPSE